MHAQRTPGRPGRPSGNRRTPSATVAIAVNAPQPVSGLDGERSGPDAARAVGFGVADLSEWLAAVPDPEPVGMVIARMQVVAGGLDRFADACGDTSLINDARVLAAAARRSGRDFTNALARLGVPSWAHQSAIENHTDRTTLDKTAPGRLL
jgi:hypothetical protein